MLITPVSAVNNENTQAGIPRNMVLDPEQFDSNQTKFEDWWREIRLFLKSNRVTETDNRITAILACLKGGIVGIYIQKKLDELNEETKNQNQEEFI